LPDGTPNSFATHKQQWLWDWLAQGFKIVPVTARDVGAFERCTLPFQEEVVLNHGAVILNKQRQLDKGWLDIIMQALPVYQEKFFALWQEIEFYAEQQQGYKPRLVNDFGTTWYGYIKHIDRSEATLTTLLETVIKPHPSIVDGSLYWHLNGNNLAVLPKIINKEDAVRYLLTHYQREYPDLLTFGAGDSRTDAAFITLCDYALIPKNTQLFNKLAQRE
jgi:hydroxymethylpyrimidine pyrophosphatase-like HAD family hydrolase